MEPKKTLIHWFRKGLRVHDNPALSKVILQAQDKCYVRPIFILDPKLLQFLNVGANRWRFLQQSLDDLNAQLQKINTRLFVIRGNPETVLTRLFKEWNVKLLTFEEDIEPYSKTRDAAIRELAKEMSVDVETFWSHTIYNPEQIMQKNFGKAPLTYQKFIELVKTCKPGALAPAPGKLSDKTVPPSDSLEKKDSSCYNVPTLGELVKNLDDLGPCKFPGGEAEALRRLDAALSRTDYIANFSKPDTSPNSLEPSTTVLSPYLKFGCLSSRLFKKRLDDLLSKHPKHTQPPVSLVGQLMWREFFYTAAASEPNFDRMMGNSFCMQIPWTENNEHLEAWKNGRTGYPFIDAIMRQLRTEGWIHHLARHAVACFLTRGDLWISWEDGQKVFEELLLDQDWALNAGNWMWLSASAFFHQFFRVYSPVAFGKKTDPTGIYIKKYVPELQKYPAGCIYEPWKASLAAQKDYGCVIGKDYPERIVVHEVVSKENIGKMSAAYKINKEVRTGKPEQNPSGSASSSSTAKKRSATKATKSVKRFKKSS